jgi:hypothetical protein
MTLHDKLVHAAVLYDQRMEQQETRRGLRVNIYRIGLILKAIENAEAAIASGKTVRQALCEFFNGRLLDRMLKAAGEPKGSTNEIRGYGAGS